MLLSATTFFFSVIILSYSFSYQHVYLIFSRPLSCEPKERQSGYERALAGFSYKAEQSDALATACKSFVQTLVIMI